VPRETQPHVDNIWQRLLEGDMTAYNINENITKDDCTIICNWSNTPLKEADGTVTGVLSMVQDITKRKQAEEELKKLYTELKESQSQLIQSEKMSAVGTLVAGVAHELNNPITAILHFTQYCIKHTSEEDRLYTILQDIEKETRSCIDTTQNLLTFSHMQRGEAVYQKESLNTILSRVLKLLSYRIEEDNISIGKHIAIGTPDILMNVNNMQQVFLNLLNNALDALKESKQKKIDIDILCEGKYVKVTIADSGCGIASEDIDNIFDPFFTTKLVGQGTGLGLSLCHSIITEHNGEITCESVPGQGARFIILLPVTTKDAKGAEGEVNNEAYFSN
jgi:two-component system NtrC family sensor kinase